MWYLDYYDYPEYLHTTPAYMEGWETHPVPQSAWNAQRSGVVMGPLRGSEVPFRILPPLEAGWWHEHRLVAVSQSNDFSMGLCSCGKVFIDGYLYWSDYERKSEMVKWKDVAALATGPETVLALRKDGRVLAPGYKKSAPFFSWRNIMQLSVGESAILGLCEDGTVQALGDDHIEREVASWHDIVQVSAGDKFVLGVRSDGTVAYADVGYEEFACDVSSWTDIAQVSAGPYHAAGLRRDGTVIVAECEMYWESMKDTECLSVGEWHDVTQVCAGNGITAALRADGWVLIAVSVGEHAGERVEVPFGAVAISVNRHYEGNDEVLVLDSQSHAFSGLVSYEGLPWDNWSAE